jgi:hypothetical protein
MLALTPMAGLVVKAMLMNKARSGNEFVSCPWQNGPFLFLSTIPGTLIGPHSKPIKLASTAMLVQNPTKQEAR